MGQYCSIPGMRTETASVSCRKQYSTVQYSTDSALLPTSALPFSSSVWFHPEIPAPLHCKGEQVSFGRAGTLTSLLTPHTYCSGAVSVPAFQFEPAPRRGEPDITRRTPDYFL